MKLIADSGSTKTDWLLMKREGEEAVLKTQGINPFHQSSEAIAEILHKELLPQLEEVEDVSEVYFYGAGVRPELEATVKELLHRSLPAANTIEAHGDLLGAARSLCGCEPGIACILGTGANSCLFDGQQIVKNTPPLGYILGDEGSGAVLGIRFLNALLKGFLPDSLRDELFETLGMTEADVIARVYRQPMANRWLASLSPFISSKLGVPEVRALVVDGFRRFASRNLVQYGAPELAVSAVGSVAWHYKAGLTEALAAEGFTVGKVVKSPIEGLAIFHQ